MDAGGRSSSSASSPIPESPTTASERRSAMQVLPQTPPDNSSGMLHQLASDLQQYEAKTTKFLKSLLPRSRSGLKEGAAQLGTSPNNNNDECSNKTQLDTHSDDASDDSQNLRGFESTIEDDRSIGSVDDDDDGEECSSSSHSDIFRSYTDKRLAMILNGRSSMASVQDSYNNNSSALMSSDGEGIVPERSSRSRSLESRGRSATRGSAVRGASGSRTRGSAPTDLASAREHQRIVQLETALSTSNPTPNGAASSPQHQQQDGKPHRVPDTNRLHYASLDRSRLAAVLRVAKDDEARAIALATSYSQLLDRLGIAQTCAGDMQEFATSRSIRLLLSNSVTRDGSKLCIVTVKKLPPVPPSNDQVRKQYAINLIRFLLYELEEARFAVMGAQGDAAGAATSGSTKVPSTQQDGVVVGSTPEHMDPTSSNAAMPKMPPKKPKKAQRVRGDSAKKRSGDAFTFLVDVGGCDNATLSAFGVVLSEGAALLRQAYPLSIAKVVLYQGGADDKHVAVPSTSTSGGDDANGASAPTATKAPRRGPMSMLTSLFQTKSTPGKTTTSNGTVDPGVADKSPRTNGSLASKVWLSVMVSTWKLRYLPHTVRSRTELVDRLEAVLDVDELRRLLDVAPSL